MGHLSDATKYANEKFPQLRDDKKWICVCGLFLAELFRYFNIFLFLNGCIMIGISRDINDNPDPNRRPNNECEVFCNLVFTIATFVAGLGFIVAAGVCWFLGWLFLFLSFIWCFQTDFEYEISYEMKFAALNGKMQRIRDEQPSSSPEISQAFEIERNRRLELLQTKIDALIDYKRQTDLIRYGRIPEEPVDVEAQVGIANQTDNNVNITPANAIVAPEMTGAAYVAANAVDDSTNVIDVHNGESFTNIHDNSRSDNTENNNNSNPSPPSSENQAQSSFYNVLSSFMPA
jgi:hypothetical protein